MRKRLFCLWLLVILFVLACDLSTLVTPDWANHVAVLYAANGTEVDRWFCSSIGWSPDTVYCERDEGEEAVVIALGEDEYVVPIDLEKEG